MWLPSHQQNSATWMHEEFSILSNIASFENETNSQKFAYQTRSKFDSGCRKKQSCYFLAYWSVTSFSRQPSLMLYSNIYIFDLRLFMVVGTISRINLKTSYNTPVPHTTETKQECSHISLVEQKYAYMYIYSEWCIVGYDLDALWDMDIWPIVFGESPSHVFHSPHLLSVNTARAIEIISYII